MPVEIFIDEEQDLTIVKYTDPWSLEEFYSSFSNKVTRNRLADLREVRSLDWIDQDTLRKISNHSQKYDSIRRGGRTAFVVSETMAQILIRLFQAIVVSEEDRTITIEVFTEYMAAMDWLSSN